MVIVMIRDELQKHDKDLNLVKETQVAIDTEHMSDMMEQMMAMCPMHQHTMLESAMQKNGVTAKK
jgi:hypothetical protein